MIVLYCDEDSMSRRLVVAWRAAGREIWTTREAGQLEATDEQQLTFATERGWIVYTCNVDDFARISAGWLRTGREHSGIVVLNEQQLDVNLQIRALELLLANVPPEHWRSRLEYLLPWARRVLESS
ncbi:MAG: DUF5615 family PIN-like protein [Dehalococcoidia bacterium]